MVTDERRPRVAIACQGGGSHTAFTAGVLDRLLAADDVGFEVVALTGTSGGAICAFAAWFGLVSDGDDGRETARQLLAEVWDGIAARTPVDAAVNAVGVGTARAQGMGVPLPTVSPYDTPVAEWARAQLRAVLEDAVDPDALDEVVGREEPPLPRLDIGAVDVQRGTFRTFTEQDVSHDAVLASAAVPPLFRTAPVTLPDGTTRWYWDGLFSQNPPLGDPFRRAEGRVERADELWVVQVNPQREAEIPRRLDAIGDRRNELGGNLSVNQEIRFLRLLNQWRAEGHLDEVYRPIEVKTIDLDESLLSPSRSLDHASKLDRSSGFVERLWEHGTRQAERFLATERDRRTTRQAVTATWTGDPGEAPADAFAPTYTVHLPTSLAELRAFRRREAERTERVLGPAEFRQFVVTLREAIPDLRFGVRELVAEPGKVAIRWRATGTHSGPLLDIEPSERSVVLSGIGIYHLDDGRLAESWVLSEQWSLLKQIAAADAPAPLSTTSRVTATPVVTQLSAPAENEQIARLVIEDVWNRGHRATLDRVLADDCVMHLDNETDIRGRDAYWAFVRRYRAAFPDLSVTVADTVSEGDKIVLRLTLRGTHEGSFLGVDPTGRSVEVSRMVVHHLDDGRIVETGIAEDTVRLLHQLGAAPAVVAP